MDPQHSTPEHLPDENYIERLFPKCPPKQTSFPGGGKPLQGARGSKEAQRKQVRSKVHQHTRRELEARRNKTQTTNYLKDKANSSESSDNDNTRSSKKNNSSKELAGEASQRSTLPTGPTLPIAPAQRRVGKYAASQSLLMQLQRSQSTNTNTNNSSNSQGDLSRNTTDPKAVITSQSQTVNRTTGIVKSSSSFAFVSEPKTLSSNPQTQQQFACSQSTINKSYETDEFHQNDSEIDGTKNDNSQSDPILGSEFNFSNNSVNGTSSSILREPSSRRDTPNQIALQNWNNNVLNYTNNLEAENIGSGSNDILPDYVNSSEVNIIDRRNNCVKLDRRNEKIITNSSNMLSATIAPSNRTADLGFREETDIDKTETQGFSGISSGPFQIKVPTTSQTHFIKPDKQISQSNKANPVIKKQDSPIKDTAEPRDDDSYINLFVYDSAAQDLQKSPAAQPDRQQQLPRSSQKKSRYRKRLDRLSNKAKTSSSKKSDVSLESTRDDSIEITGIHEKEPPVVSQPPSGSSQKEPVVSSIEEILAQTSQPLAHCRQEHDLPNIVSIHHQASLQLLASNDTNDQDESVVRNDASTEELCSNSDNLIEEPRKSTDISRNKHNTDQGLDRSSSSKNSTHPRASSIVATLQTVDEKAEIGIQEESVVEDDRLDKVEIGEEQSNSDTMPIDQSTNYTTKKSFVPPGYPQLVRPVKSTAGGHKVDFLNLVEDIRESKSNSMTNDKPDEPTTLGNNISEELCSKEAQVDNLRVKFDEDGLVRVRDQLSLDQGSPDTDQNSCSSASTGDKFFGTSARRNEHPPQMPCISEVQFELEIESSKDEPTTIISSPIERDLSASLKRVSINDSPSQRQVAPSDLVYQTDIQSDISQPQAQSTHRKNSNPHTPEQKEVGSHQPVSQEQIDLYQNQDALKASKLNTVTEPSLRHHKLLNETSHYSIVRAAANSTQSEHASVPRSSSIQFNTFSDGESEPEESLISSTNIRDPSNDRNYPNLIKKSDQSSIGYVNRPTNPSVSSVKNLNDDDMMPTTKTALIFPRLDEGLSSEAESCEDEIEEEDEKAMDADVDADDDDDDDDADDDITENDNLSVDRGAQPLQVHQSTSLECFSRLPQTAKSQIRLIGSVQQQHQHQHSQPLVGSMTQDQQIEIHQAKAPGAAYGSYISPDLIDHNDLKAVTSYPNHNGQSNYWMGVTSQQAQLSATQPSSSQHFSQRNHHNNNSFNRDEAKVTSRLSSDTDNETDRLLGSQRNDQLKLVANDVNSNNSSDLQPVSNNMKQTASSREVLIEGVLFNVRYLGSTHSDCEGRSEKEDRIHQAEMAVHEVKFRNGESQSATEVQLFISTEKIMVLDDKHRKIMMDHSLRTISYIADIGDSIVLIVRKKNSNIDTGNDLNRPVSKISCHVFESSESHTITKSISQAFQVAYTELLKANGTGDSSSYLPKELDYQEVLNSQEMSTDELEMFARKENQREVIVPKEKGEILGVSLVESGWGSVLPTVVIANLKPDGPAYRCKRLSIGDQILSVNGISLVGLPLAECQEILRKTKNQRVARLSVVPCPITVEVKIKRPDTKYQLGFSVQNGVICSLLRGGIAERGGVRVGHRIMSINGTTVVGVPHEKIVTLLASSVGEIRMKTCLTSLYRLILGEENPVHF